MYCARRLGFPRHPLGVGTGPAESSTVSAAAYLGAAYAGIGQRMLASLGLARVACPAGIPVLAALP